MEDTAFGIMCGLSLNPFTLTTNIHRTPSICRHYISCLMLQVETKHSLFLQEFTRLSHILFQQILEYIVWKEGTRLITALLKKLRVKI